MSATGPQPVKTAILVSGRGSNLRAILEARSNGRLPMADIRIVVSNDPAAPALDIARQHGLPAVAVDHRAFKGNREGHERAILEEFAKVGGVDFIVLAGYMRLLTPALLGPFAGRMINIHPSLLPAFPGVDAQRQAVEYGVKFSGCTVHFVTESMDAGPIILQRMVPVSPADSRDTLAARILVEEHQALPYAIDLYTRGRLRVEGRRVDIIAGDSSFPELEGVSPQATPVLLATGNRHKAQEIRAILMGVSLAFRTTDQFPGFTEPSEDAPDYLGNARIKARAWYDRTGLWTLADDSGLEVDALGGRPGVHSSRYAPTTPERNAKLLAELAGVPEEQRTARFVCAVVLHGPGGKEFHATGVCEGRIGFEARGAEGFGYDPLFIPNGFGGKHLAELSESTKNNISHRARALFALKPVLEKLARGAV